VQDITKLVFLVKVRKQVQGQGFWIGRESTIRHNKKKIMLFSLL
jgi:hypothetical protein